MEPFQLDNFKRWFDAYTGRFFGDDEHINRHLRSKREHTRRTCEEILLLADGLALDDNQKRVAEVVALLHDIGRFPQVARYRTFNDAASVDHSRLGVEILRRERLLATARREERQWVETAIEHHNRKSLPAGLNGQALLFARLIRDADKLDIYRVVLELHYQHERSPEKFKFETELPNVPEYSPEVLKAVMERQTVSYDRLRTLNDLRICQIGWVYDMNFVGSLARLRERGFLDKLFDLLPQTSHIEEARDKILAYLADQAGSAL